MEIIRGMKKSFSDILGRQEYNPNTQYVPISYLKKCKLDHHLLIENTLTTQVISLVEDEIKDFDPDYSNNTILKTLTENWFMIPDNVSERSVFYTVINSYRYRYRRSGDSINGFTIFTTTDCNARCPYCYEHGIKKRNMTSEMALDVAKYIANVSGNRAVSIGWFGGEPLYNAEAIDIISDYLATAGISYASSIITNGLLLSKYNQEHLRKRWNLQRAQITLDGTENEYNRIKGYIENPENAFEQVLSNVKLLAEMQINVSIRLNLSDDNADDLKKLISVLQERFSGNTYITVYVHPLFSSNSDHIYEKYIDLDKSIRDSGLKRSSGIDNFKIHHCMADNDSYVCVTPEGNLTPCEHYCDDEIIGTIQTGITNTEKANEWKEHAEETECCASCWYYPKCNRLKKCPAEMPCTDGMRDFLAYQEEENIKEIYEAYKNAQKTAENTHVQTQIDPKKVIRIAQNRIGDTLSDRDYWSEIFPNRKQRGWCAPFLYSIFNDAYGEKVAHTLLYATGYAFPPHVHAKRFRDVKAWYHDPQVGDWAFFKGSGGWISHVELVTAIYTDAFETIGGNVETIVGSSVQKQVHALNAEYIVGFGRPQWTF